MGRRGAQRTGISEIIAILLVITITLIAASVAYVIVFENIGRLSNTGAAQIQASLLMTSSTTADVNINIYNTGQSPISAVSIASGASGCTGWSGPVTPIAPGSSGVITATGCTAAVGTPQVWSFDVTFSDGPASYQVSITPSY
jgi:FlaG/FlaF family flagellin (archaellin)